MVSTTRARPSCADARSGAATNGSPPFGAAPPTKLYIFGLTILVAFVARVEWAPRTGSWPYLAFVGAASAAYLAAVYELARRRLPSRAALLICLLLGLLWRIPLLLPPAGQNDDAYRYLWDARLQRLGYDPYVAIPADPKLAYLHTPGTRKMNNPGVPTPYPPGAQIFFRVVTAFHDSVHAFRVALLICDALVVVVLWRWLTAVGSSPWWVLAFAWNPLVAMEGPGHGHLDVLGVLCLLTSVLALTRRRTALAAVTFVLAVSVKLLPIVLAPMYWRRIRWRDAILGAGVLVALYAPYWSDGFPIGSLGRFVDRFRFNSPLFEWLDDVLSPRTLAIIAVAAGVGIASWLRFRVSVRSPAGWAWPMAVALLLSPVIYPWYLVWFTPFLTTLATVPLLVWTVSVLSTYRVWYAARLGAPWIVPGWLTWLQFGVVGAAGLWLLWRSYDRREPRELQDSAEGD